MRDIMEMSYAFRVGDFGYLDWRTCTKADRDDYHVKGWVPRAPLSVCVEGSGVKPEFELAMAKMSEYSPLLMAVVRSTRKKSFWSGYTGELAKRLEGNWPVPWTDPLFVGSTDEIDWDGFPSSMSLLEFYNKMDAYVPILEEVGIELTHAKSSPGARTRWSIQAPPWKINFTLYKY